MSGLIAGIKVILQEQPADTDAVDLSGFDLTLVNGVEASVKHKGHKRGELPRIGEHDGKPCPVGLLPSQSGGKIPIPIRMLLSSPHRPTKIHRRNRPATTGVMMCGRNMSRLSVRTPNVSR